MLANVPQEKLYFDTGEVIMTTANLDCGEVILTVLVLTRRSKTHRLDLDCGSLVFALAILSHSIILGYRKLQIASRSCTRIKINCSKVNCTFLFLKSAKKLQQTF